MRFPTGKTTLAKAKGTQRDTEQIRDQSAVPKWFLGGTIVDGPAWMRQSLAVDLGTVAE